MKQIISMCVEGEKDIREAIAAIDDPKTEIHRTVYLCVFSTTTNEIKQKEIGCFEKDSIGYEKIEDVIHITGTLAFKDTDHPLTSIVILPWLYNSTRSDETNLPAACGIRFVAHLVFEERTFDQLHGVYNSLE